MLRMRATVPLRMRPVPPPSGQVGARYEGRSLCAKAKGLRGTTGVRQSPLLKPLSGRYALPQVVASKPSLHRSASLVELELYFSSRTAAFNFLTLNVNGIRDPIKHAGLLQWLGHLSCDFVCLQETYLTDAAEATSWFSSSGFLAFRAPGTAHSRRQVLLIVLMFLLSTLGLNLKDAF